MRKAARFLPLVLLVSACAFCMPVIACADEGAGAGAGGGGEYGGEYAAVQEPLVDEAATTAEGPAATTAEGPAADVAAEPAEQLALEASSSSEGRLDDGVYTIIASTGDSKALDVPGGSTESGTDLQIYTQNATPAQRWSIQYLGDSLYEITNVKSGMALDVSGGNAEKGTAVQQYRPNSTTAQKWKIVSVEPGLYKLVSALSDSYALDVSGGSSENGAAVQLWTDNGTKAQLWSIVATRTIDEGLYVVANNGSGMVLDVSSGSIASGANIQQYNANGTYAQTFYFGYSPQDGYYTISGLGSGKVLDVAGGSSQTGANVQQYTSNGTLAQKWAAVRNADGTFTFRSAIGGLAIDVSGGSAKKGANVQVYTNNGTNAQKWTLSAVSDWLQEGTYTIVSALNVNNALDISAGSTASGANVQVYSDNGTNAQRFYLRLAEDGSCTIQNPVSGKYLNVTGASSGGNVVLGTTMQQFKLVAGVGGITFQLKDDASLVLDVAGGSTAKGANVQVYKSNGTAAQKFAIRVSDLFADGLYSIRYAADADFVLDVPSASKEAGVQLQLYQSNGTAAQRFSLKRVAADTYTMTVLCSSKALQAVMTEEGSYELRQQVATGAADQQWAVSLDADGAIQFAPKSDEGYRMDLSANAVEKRTPIIVHAANGSDAQKWKLVLEKGSITYDALDLTLRRMAELQKGNSYYSDLTVSDLIELLDPDNLDMSQFLDLRVVTGVTADQLNDFIVSTSTGRSGLLKGLGSAFVSASQQYGVNEVYLLAHAILESGWGTSTLANGYDYDGGYIDGEYYPAGTYYNFYGIGAYDSSPLSGGRKLAIINGWNTPEKAVTGAAKWIAGNYIYANSYAQPTLYAMKWDYARSDATGERGWHQYATSTSWPASIARLINECYSSAGASSSQVFLVPEYW